jgi:hypothetical protein
MPLEVLVLYPDYGGFMSYRVVEGYVYPFNSTGMAIITVVLVTLALVGGFFFIDSFANVFQILLSRNG